MGVGEPELKLWNGLTILEWGREVPSSSLGLLPLLLQPKAALASRCSHDPTAFTNLWIKWPMTTQHRLWACTQLLPAPILYLCLGTSVTD